MIGRIATTVLAGSIALFSPIGSALAADDKSDGNDATEKVVLRKEQDNDEVATIVDRDDDRDDDGDTGMGGTNSRVTSGVNSKDGTNSRKTAVSRDRDHSRGDLTRDRTKDGPGKDKRDWSQNGTNDRSRNDTR